MDATELSLGVTLAVLGAGLLHAGWNALLKAAPGGDPLLDTATVVAGSAVWGLARDSVRRTARCRRVEIRRRLGADPLGLLHDAGAGLSHRRPVVCVSADARHRAAASSPCSGSFSCASCPRRTSPPASRSSAPASSASPSFATSAIRRRPRRGRSRTPRSSPPTRWSTAAGARASGNRGGLRRVADLSRGAAVPRLDPRAARRCGLRLRAPRLAARTARRRLQPRRLRHRAVGDDARARRRRRGAARDVGALRRADRRRCG